MIKDGVTYLKEKQGIQLIVQTTQACNLRCRHCYESDQEYPTAIMSDEVLERIIYLAMKDYQKVDFLWFGGEPLLAGLSFFEKIVAYQKKYQSGHEIKNHVQTNATLLDDDFACFFKENDFGVSISFDGKYNDVLRQKSEETVNGIETCKRHGIRPAVLSVIHAENYWHQYEMYRDFAEKELPCKFNRIFQEGCVKKNKQLLISNEDFIAAEKEFFKEWTDDERGRDISTFNICFASLYDLKRKECLFTGCLFKWLSFSPTGEVYTCPRFIGTEYVFGNVFEKEALHEFFLTDKYRELTEKAIVRRKSCKEKCALYQFCNGGCNAQCVHRDGLEFANSDLCDYVKNFFPFVAEQMYLLLKQDSARNPYIKDFLKKHKEKVESVYQYFVDNLLIK